MNGGSAPTIGMRPGRPYAGTRTVMAMRDFDRETPAMTAPGRDRRHPIIKHCNGRSPT